MAVVRKRWNKKIRRSRSIGMDGAIHAGSIPLTRGSRTSEGVRVGLIVRAETPNAPHEGGGDPSRPSPPRVQPFLSEVSQPGAWRRVRGWIGMRGHDKQRLPSIHRSRYSGPVLLARRVETGDETGDCSSGDGWMLPTRRVNAPHETGECSPRDGIVEATPRSISPARPGQHTRMERSGSRLLACAHLTAGL